MKNKKPIAEIKVTLDNVEELYNDKSGKIYVYGLYGMEFEIPEDATLEDVKKLLVYNATFKKY